MGLINGVADDVARGYSAPLPVTRTSESKAKDAITGKELPASVVEISPEARARLAQDKAEPISQEQKDKNIKEIASLRASLQGPTVNLGYALFNDPVTSWDARTFNPLLNMTATKTQDAMDDFAAALHDVLVDGQVGRNKYDNSDTSEAMALTLTQAKLHTLIEKYVSGNDQKQAKDIADEMISEKVAIREHVTLLGAQETLTLANQHGTREMQNSARDYLKQVESGTARPQIELSGMMEAMRSGSDKASVFSVFATLIRATPNSGNAAQPSIDGALNQLGVYQQQWQAFSEKYAS